MPGGAVKLHRAMLICISRQHGHGWHNGSSPAAMKPDPT